MTIYVGNTNLLRLEGMKNAQSGAFINDATAVVTLRDNDGQPLAGGAWPLAMPHVAASSGDYEAVLDAALPFVVGRRYLADFYATAPNGLVYRRRYSFRPEVRQ